MNKRFWYFCNSAPGDAVLLTLLVLALLVPSLTGQSLWQDGNSRPLVADKRAAMVGDLVSVVVQESSTTTKDNSTKTGKKSSIDASIETFLYSPQASSFLTKNGKMPALKTAAKQDFDGGGKIANSERILARVSAQVVDVLPNQNLVIEGKRLTSFSGETQEILLRGVVRPADISANNTVFSYNVADATLKFVAKGTVSDNQRKGWFTRVWEKVTPF
ncbi:MAG: Flagellar L-ring protein precursor [Verrucomicrobiota bacterium]|jgi:flagellar L-ring protein precursor FlgH